MSIPRIKIKKGCGLCHCMKILHIINWYQMYSNQSNQSETSKCNVYQLSFAQGMILMRSGKSHGLKRKKVCCGTLNGCFCTAWTLQRKNLPPCWSARLVENCCCMLRKHGSVLMRSDVYRLQTGKYDRGEMYIHNITAKNIEGVIELLKKLEKSNKKIQVGTFLIFWFYREGQRRRQCCCCWSLAAHARCSQPGYKRVSFIEKND